MCIKIEKGKMFFNYHRCKNSWDTIPPLFEGNVYIFSSFSSTTLYTQFKISGKIPCNEMPLKSEITATKINNFFCRVSFKNNNLTYL